MTTTNQEAPMTEVPEVLDAPPPAMPANQLLLELDNGQVHSELTDAIAELVQLVQETGKGGSVALKINFAPAKLRDPAVLISSEISLRKPKLARDPSIRFTDENGGLHRSNPRQQELPGLRPIHNDRRSA
jgi:hypothetical protein